MYKMKESTLPALTVTRPKSFKIMGSFEGNGEVINQVFDFAYEMSFGNYGKHRDCRSGGNMHRKNGQIFANVFQGKLAEFAVYHTIFKLLDKSGFKARPSLLPTNNQSKWGNWIEGKFVEIELNKPDLDTYGLGEWDDFDFKINKKNISVKSTKDYGNLLLLEKKDWNDEAEYIPNLSKGTAIYDYFILVRIKPDCDSLMKDLKIFYNNELLSDKDSKLRKKVEALKWEYDIPGFVSRKDMHQAISEDYVIHKGVFLNEKTPMDASNYYIQAGDMYPIEKIIGKILEL